MRSTQSSFTKPSVTRWSKTLSGTAALFALGAVFCTSALAGEEKNVFKHVIKLQADGAEVIEADVSNLAPGEAQTFTTESGRVVDILHGIDGMEIYLDGELLDIDSPDELAALHSSELHEVTEHCLDEECDDVSVHEMHKKVQIICEAEDDADCDNMVFIGTHEDDLVNSHLDGEEKKVFIIRKEVRKSSSD